MANVFADHRYDELSRIIRRLQDTSDTHVPNRMTILHGTDIKQLAFVSTRKCLFLEHINIVKKVLWDSCRIYSYLSTSAYGEARLGYNVLGLVLEAVTHLVRIDLAISYSKLSFYQTMNFIKYSDDRGNLIDIHHLLSFLGELRASASALCPSDRRAISTMVYANQAYMQKDNNFCDKLNSDASFLLCWTSVEASKYCIAHKLCPVGLGLDEFLSFLEKEISAPVSPSNKISRKLFLDFMKNLDKFLSNMTTYSSSETHTLYLGKESHLYYRSNSHRFRLWFLEHRLALANLAIILDEPAECWRNASIRSWYDLEAKLGISKGSKSSSEETLTSLGPENWRKNVITMAQSARTLGDMDLMYGLMSLTGPKGALCNNLTHEIICAISNNSEGKCEANYEAFKDRSDLDQACLVEFLESCIDCNCLEDHRDSIDMLKSEALRQYYKLQVELSTNFKTKDISKSRIEMANEWLTTWTQIKEDFDPSESQIIADGYVDLVIPAYLRELCDESNLSSQPTLIDHVQQLISTNMMCQSLFLPNRIHRRLEIFTCILDTIRGSSPLESLVNGKNKDLGWNMMLCKALYDYGITDIVRNRSEILMDQIQLKAAKFHMKHGNVQLSTSLASDLYNNSTKEDISRLASNILVQLSESDEEKLDSLKEQILGSMDPNLTEPLRLKFWSKSTRRMLATSPDEYVALKARGISEQHLMQANFLSKYDELLVAGESRRCFKLIAALSERSGQLSKGYTSCKDYSLLNQLFNFDLKLLSNQMSSQSGCRKVYFECANRILTNISKFHSYLNQDNLEAFTSQKFLNATLRHWIPFRCSIISAINYERDFNPNWRSALIELVKCMIKDQPQMFIYEIVANRIDAQNNLAKKQKKSLERGNKPDDKLETAKSRLYFWDQLSELVKQRPAEKYIQNWSQILDETYIFVKEMKRISFLQGDHLKKMLRFLHARFIGPLERSLKTLEGSSESRKIPADAQVDVDLIKIDEVCDEFKSYLSEISEKNEAEAETSYDRWFNLTFGWRLNDIATMMNDIKKIGIKDNIQTTKSLLENIKTTCVTCRHEMAVYNQTNQGLLFMSTISPVLAKFDFKQLLMPDTCHKVHLKNTEPISIHKVNQTISQIVSKTCPKRLIFIGSDGQSRSFLLKSQEDLRLDQLVMNIFSYMNVLFASNKEANGKFRLREYSVTPMGSTFGLIRWVNAPSLHSLYLAWLKSENGRQMMKDVYHRTCSSLCDSDKPSHLHKRCKHPKTAQSGDLFFQLLWARIQHSRSSLAQTKPTPYTSMKYRTEFGPAIMQNVVAELTDFMPSELISNQLWYISNNSHSYWLKTNAFSRSCATISMVGYILGIGDRHLDNILLDYDTGEVIHVDFTLCFDQGRDLPIPEQVPFRLTHNIIRAFGFAGLEGSFLLSCRKVLKIMRESKETILGLLDWYCELEEDDTILERIDDKLTGVDSHLSQTYKNELGELGIDGSMRIDDHVNALIMDANSIVNKAAMFEGWHPWV